MLSNWVFTSSGHLYRVARWLSFATTPQQWLIFARRAAQDLLSSTPWLRRSCVGRSPSPFAWLRSSSRAPTMSSRTPCLALADALSRPHQLPHSEWSLNLTVFQSLRRLWPVQIDLFATSDNHRCSIYFSPFQDPMSAGTDAFLQSWDSLQAYAFPPVAVIPRVLAKLRASTGDGAHTSSSTVGPAPLVLRPAPAFAGSSSGPAGPSRPLALASVSSSLPGSPSAQASCLATLQRFTRAAGFSSAVAEQSSLARCPSSRSVYQVRWSIYRAWCHDNGHSVSRPTLAKVADFCIGCGTPGASVFPPCVVTVQCYLRCSVFTSLPCLRIR